MREEKNGGTKEVEPSSRHPLAKSRDAAEEGDARPTTRLVDCYPVIIQRDFGFKSPSTDCNSSRRIRAGTNRVGFCPGKAAAAKPA